MTQGKPPAQFLYEMKPGENWATFKGMLIITHPEREPKIIHLGGREEVLKPDPNVDWFDETSAFTDEQWANLRKR